MQQQTSLIKRRLSVIVCLSLFLLLAPILSSIASAHATTSTPKIELEHSIQIIQGGVIIVNDTISIQNEDVEPITSFTIGFHKDFAKNLDNATVTTALGEQLTIKREDVD